VRQILALDQGTTSSRAALFGHDGAVRGVAQREFTQLFPRPGWVEHDPREIWASQVGVAAEVLSRCGVAPRDIAAIGIANQRETTIVWDRADGQPVCNAIVWQDRRTAPMCDRLVSDGVGPLFRERTGLVVDAYFSATKIRWILDTVPGARARAESGGLCFGTVDTWLVWNLTGGRLHLTDPGNASRTMLYDIVKGDWDDELLGIMGIPRAMMPEVRPSSAVLGDTSAAFGSTGIPIAGIAGDQQAALFGQLCLQPGMVKNTYGTGCFMLLNTGHSLAPSRHGLLSTVAWDVAGATAYALEGSVFIAGAVVQWLRDGLGLVRSSGEVEALAASVPDNGGVCVVPAFAGLGAPHWDSGARGLIAGITRGTTSGHIARAALEGIAHQVADVMDAMRADAQTPITEIRVDGGAASNDLLMQFQSDILGIPIVRPRNLETTAQGAAYLAGLAVGFWDGTQDLEGMWQANRRFEPGMGEQEIAAHRGNWCRALERSRGWVGDGG
jgi:glycerol kinase